jgi:hypothetical protein
MAEFGIFDDSGCLDTGYVSFEAAQWMINSEPSYFTGAHVAETCPEHREQPAADCEECLP